MSKKFYQPKVTFPIIKMLLYKDEYSIFKFLDDNKLNDAIEGYTVKATLNKSNTVNYCLFKNNDLIIEFNEYAAVPSLMMNYDAHVIWREFNSKAKNYIKLYSSVEDYFD